MRLHWLWRCVTRNARGIMSGTMNDMVQSVASLKPTRERIMSHCSEKIVFLLSETHCWIGICAFTHPITIWTENFFPCALWEIHSNLHTRPPAFYAHTLVFDSLFLWFLCLLWHPQTSFTGGKTSNLKQKVVTRTFTANVARVAAVVQTTSWASFQSVYPSMSRWIQLCIPCQLLSSGEKQSKQDLTPHPTIRVCSGLVSYCCGDGELSLVSHCRDRVRPWLPQHPVPIFTSCGLAQEQPQQPSVGHHLHHTSAAAPAASSRAQVRANTVYSAGCQHVSQLSALEAQSGQGWPDLAGCGGSHKRDEMWSCITWESCHLKLRV